MKGRLYKDTHRLGYNTRDNPQDVPAEACRSMVNCLPGHPSPLPRDGIDSWNSNALAAAPNYVFPWRDRTEPKIILNIGEDFYWQKAGSGALTLIAAGVVPGGTALSSFRIKDMLYVNTDIPGTNHKAWIFAWTGTTFSIRNANIAPPDVGLSAVAAAGSNMANAKYRSYAVSFVNRDDEGSMDGSDNPVACDLQQVSGNGEGFHPGLLESIENLDQRYIFHNTTGSACAPRVTITLNSGTLDTQITHARLWVTEEGDTAEEVAGFDHRWVADIPVKGTHATASPWEWTDLTTVGELAGDLDLLKTTGFDPIPAGTYMLFHQGLLWIGGAGTGEEVGRNLYSEAPQDVEFPAKWFSLFSLSENFKDTSYEDAEPCVGIGLSQNDVVFIGSRSVYYLRDGDPTFEPSLMDKNKGTQFPNSITSVNQDMLFISNEGPCAIVGRQIQVLDGHTAGEVWPRTHDNSQGYFFGLSDKTAVRGFYYRENWWLTDGVKLIGMYMPSSGTAQGPWEVQPADSTIGFGLPCVLDEGSVCVLTSDTQAAPRLWWFLHKGVSLDNSVEYWLKSNSKAYYINPKNRDKSGELFSIKVFTHYEDSATMYITARCDFFRFILELGYNEYGSDNQLISPDARVSFRNILDQAFPEGMVFQFVEIEWRKLHRTPYAFTHKGWALEYLPVDGHPSEFVSRSSGDGLVLPFTDALLYLKFDENSNTAEDASIFDRDHGYSAGSGGSRTFDQALAPGGGQALVGGPGSGYTDVDWTATDYIGDNAGLNGSPLTYEYVVKFPSLASEQVIHEGGDGTRFWRLAVKADGSLEYQLRTTVLAYRFTSPAGSIIAGTWYTIQFVLSNQGLNGQYYAAPRAGAFAELLTTRSALP